MPELMVSIISGLIVGAWVACNIIGFITMDVGFEVPLGLHGAFVAVMGYYGFTGYRAFQTNEQIKRQKSSKMLSGGN
jgi:hypothetical protein